MWSLKTRPKPGFASFAARSFSGTGLVAGRISNFKLTLLPSSVGTGAFLAVCMFSSGPAGAIGLNFTTTNPARPVSIAIMPFQDMLLRRAEVQYVRRKPFGNRTVVQFPAQAAIFGFSGHVKRYQE